jgi:hypothetical protein
MYSDVIKVVYWKKDATVPIQQCIDEFKNHLVKLMSQLTNKLRSFWKSPRLLWNQKIHYHVHIARHMPLS